MRKEKVNKSQRKKLEKLYDNLKQYQQTLSGANTPDEINYALHKLAVFAEQISHDSDIVSAFNSHFYSFRGIIYSARLNNATDKDLNYFFEVLIKHTDKLLTENNI